MAHSITLTLADLPNGNWGFDESREAVEEPSGREYARTLQNGQFSQTEDEKAAHIGWVWDKSWGMWVPVKWNGPAKPKEVKPITEIANIPLIKVPTPKAIEEDLRAWWETTSEHDLEDTVPKAVAYGSESMVEYGRTLGRLSGRRLTDAEALEWAIFAYMQGKMGRWLAALQRGERCDADTLKDLTVYSLMARKVQDTGMWT